jgi:hypothetical protein
MRTVSHQGMSLTAGQRRALALRAAVRPAATSQVDFDRLRAQLDSRQFVGPQTPISLRREFSDDAETARYWRMAADFKRYGYCEQRAAGTPWVGDAFGY